MPFPSFTPNQQQFSGNLNRPQGPMPMQAPQMAPQSPMMRPTGLGQPPMGAPTGGNAPGGLQALAAQWQAAGMPQRGWQGQPNVGAWQPGAGAPPWAQGGAPMSAPGGVPPQGRGWQGRPNVGNWQPGMGPPPWANMGGQRLLGGAPAPAAPAASPLQTVLGPSGPPARTDVVFPHEIG